MHAPVQRLWHERCLNAGFETSSHPQPQLRGRIAFADSSREFLAIALRTLGLSANTRASDLPSASGVTVEQLQQRLIDLRGQARVFSSKDHIRALGSGA